MDRVEKGAISSVVIPGVGRYIKHPGLIAKGNSI